MQPEVPTLSPAQQILENTMRANERGNLNVLVESCTALIRARGYLDPNIAANLTKIGADPFLRFNLHRVLEADNLSPDKSALLNNLGVAAILGMEAIVGKFNTPEIQSALMDKISAATGEARETVIEGIYLAKALGMDKDSQRRKELERVARKNNLDFKTLKDIRPTNPGRRDFFTKTVPRAALRVAGLGLGVGLGWKGSDAALSFVSPPPDTSAARVNTTTRPQPTAAPPPTDVPPDLLPPPELPLTLVPTPGTSPNIQGMREFEKVEERKLSTHGRFNVIKPDLYTLERGRRVELPSGFKEFSIQGFGSGYKFKIYIPESGATLEVPIWQVEILDNPTWKIQPSIILGIRNDSSKEMSLVKELGATRVRIAVEEGKITSELKETIEAAKREGLTILLNYNPKKLPSAEEIDASLREVLGHFSDYDHSKVIIEAGNEPDNKDVEFWQKRDPNGFNEEDISEFAEFIKIASEQIAQINPKVKFMVGALANPGYYHPFVQKLREIGTNLEPLIWGIHAYGNVNDVHSRAKVIFKEIPGAKISFSEIGSFHGRAMADLLEAALQYNPDGIYIHELLKFEEEGLIDPYTLKPNPNFFLAQCFAYYHPG